MIAIPKASMLLFKCEPLTILHPPILLFLLLGNFYFLNHFSKPPNIAIFKILTQIKYILGYFLLNKLCSVVKGILNKI